MAKSNAWALAETDAVVGGSLRIDSVMQRSTRPIVIGTISCVGVGVFSDMVAEGRVMLLIKFQIPNSNG